MTSLLARLLRRRSGSAGNSAIPSDAHGLDKSDALILKLLVSKGANLDEPRNARYYVYADTKEAADLAAEAARAEGFNVTVQPAASGKSQLLVLCEQNAAINP